MATMYHWIEEPDVAPMSLNNQKTAWRHAEEAQIVKYVLGPDCSFHPIGRCRVGLRDGAVLCSSEED